jgi:hypothetical protein
MEQKTKSKTLSTIKKRGDNGSRTRSASLSQLESLLARLSEIGERMTPDEQFATPTDFASNVEHYLYGAQREV